jgi:polyphosphate glucokinase
MHMEFLLWPDLIIVGGGVSKYDGKFMKHINIKSKLIPAQLLNNAGIIGAAIAAKKEFKPEKNTAAKS